MKKLTLACVLVVVSTSSHGSVLKLWDFDDAAGTYAYQTRNGGDATETFNSAGVGNYVTTDGNGLLILDNLGLEGHRADLGGDLAFGHACIRVDFASWDLSSLRHPSETYMASVYFTESRGGNGSLVGIKRSSSGVALTVGGLGASPMIDLSLDMVSTDSLSVILDRDLDANTVNAWYRFGRDGDYSLLGSFATTKYHARRINMTNSDRLGWGENYVAIDAIAVTTTMLEALAIPEPTSLAFIGVVGGACLWIRRAFVTPVP